MGIIDRIGLVTVHLPPDLGGERPFFDVDPQTGLLRRDSFSNGPVALFPTAAGDSQDALLRRVGFFLAPSDVRDDGGGPSGDMAQLVALISRFSATGDLGALQEIERMAREEGPLRQTALQALRGDINDVSALGARASSDPDSFLALMRLCLRYQNPAAVRFLLNDGHFTGLARFAGSEMGIRDIRVLFGLTVAEAFGVSAERIPPLARNINRISALEAVLSDGVGSFDVVDSDFRRLIDSQGHTAEMREIFRDLANMDPSSIPGMRDFLSSHVGEVQRLLYALAPYHTGTGSVWSEVNTSSRLNVSLQDITHLQTTMAAGGAGAVEAFSSLYRVATYPASSPEREAANVALREARFSGAAWRILAGNHNFMEATAAWEVLGEAGLRWNNPTARAALHDADLSSASDMVVRIIRNRYEQPFSLPLFYAALAALWGNRTIVPPILLGPYQQSGWLSPDAIARDVGVQWLEIFNQSLADRFPYIDDSSSDLFVEGNYQAALRSGEVAPDAQRIHDLLVSLHTWNPGPTDPDSRRLQADAILGQNYLVLLARIGDGLSLNRSNDELRAIELPPFLQAILTRIISDEILAEHPLAIHLLVALQSHDADLSLQALRIVSDALRTDPDLRLRLLHFTARNLFSLGLFDESGLSLASLRSIFSNWTAHNALNDLAQIQDPGRRLNLAISVYGLRAAFPDWENSLAQRRDQDDLFLHPNWQRDIPPYFDFITHRSVIESHGIVGAPYGHLGNPRAFRSILLAIDDLLGMSDPDDPLWVHNSFRVMARLQEGRNALRRRNPIYAERSDEELDRDLAFSALASQYASLFPAAGIADNEGLEYVLAQVRDAPIFDEDGAALRGVEDNVLRWIAQRSLEQRDSRGGRGLFGAPSTRRGPSNRSFPWQFREARDGRVTASTTPSTGQGVPAIYGGNGLSSGRGLMPTAGGISATSMSHVPRSLPVGAPIVGVPTLLETPVGGRPGFPLPMLTPGFPRGR